MKFSQFGIKCSTERERVNLFPVNGCLSKTVNFCCAVGGVCFLRKKESYICLEVALEIGTEPQFSLIYGVQGMSFISFVQTEDLIIVFQSDGRE